MTSDGPEAVRVAVLRALPAEGLGRPLHVHERVGSTSDLVKDLALAGAPEGTTVLALEQTAGRGRRGSRWLSPRGLGLYLSVLLRPPWSPVDAAWLSVAAAVAAARTLEDAGVPALRIKSPNDLLADGRKICGLLVEPRAGAHGLQFAIVGVGINLRQQTSDWPPEAMPYPVTSCRAEGVELTIAGAAARFLAELGTAYAASCAGGREALFRAWRERGGNAGALAHAFS